MADPKKPAPKFNIDGLKAVPEPKSNPQGDSWWSKLWKVYNTALPDLIPGGREAVESFNQKLDKTPSNYINGALMQGLIPGSAELATMLTGKDGAEQVGRGIRHIIENPTPAHVTQLATLGVGPSSLGTAANIVVGLNGANTAFDPSKSKLERLGGGLDILGGSLGTLHKGREALSGVQAGRSAGTAAKVTKADELRQAVQDLRMQGPGAKVTPEILEKQRKIAEEVAKAPGGNTALSIFGEEGNPAQKYRGLRTAPKAENPKFALPTDEKPVPTPSVTEIEEAHGEGLDWHKKAVQKNIADADKAQIKVGVDYFKDKSKLDTKLRTAVAEQDKLAQTEQKAADAKKVADVDARNNLEDDLNANKGKLNEKIKKDVADQDKLQASDDEKRMADHDTVRSINEASNDPEVTRKLNEQIAKDVEDQKALEQQIAQENENARIKGETGNVPAKSTLSETSTSTNPDTGATVRGVRVFGKKSGGAGAPPPGKQVPRGFLEGGNGGGGATPEGPTPLTPSHDEEAIFNELAADAMKQGYTGSYDDLRAAFDAKMGGARDLHQTMNDADLAADPKALLRRISSLGGITEAEGQGSEFASLADKTGGKVRGVNSVIRKTGGKTPDVIRHLIASDPSFSHIKLDSIEDLKAAIQDAATRDYNPTTLASAAEGAGLKKGSKWWETAPQSADAGEAAADEVPLHQPAGDETPADLVLNDRRNPEVPDRRQGVAGDNTRVPIGGRRTTDLPSSGQTGTIPIGDREGDIPYGSDLPQLGPQDRRTGDIRRANQQGPLEAGGGRRKLDEPVIGESGVIGERVGDEPFLDRRQQTQPDDVIAQRAIDIPEGADLAAQAEAANRRSPAMPDRRTGVLRLGGRRVGDVEGPSNIIGERYNDMGIEQTQPQLEQPVERRQGPSPAGVIGRRAGDLSPEDEAVFQRASKMAQDFAEADQLGIPPEEMNHPGRAGYQPPSPDALKRADELLFGKMQEEPPDLGGQAPPPQAGPDEPPAPAPVPIKPPTGPSPLDGGQAVDPLAEIEAATKAGDNAMRMGIQRPPVSEPPTFTPEGQRIAGQPNQVQQAQATQIANQQATKAVVTGTPPAEPTLPGMEDVPNVENPTPKVAEAPQPSLDLIPEEVKKVQGDLLKGVDTANAKAPRKGLRTGRKATPPAGDMPEAWKNLMQAEEQPPNMMAEQAPPQQPPAEEPPAPPAAAPQPTPPPTQPSGPGGQGVPTAFYESPDDAARYGVAAINPDYQATSAAERLAGIGGKETPARKLGRGLQIAGKAQSRIENEETARGLSQDIQDIENMPEGKARKNFLDILKQLGSDEQSNTAGMFERLAKGQQGGIDPQLAIRLGAGTAAGAAGYQWDPLDNRPLSALALGLGVGLGPSFINNTLTPKLVDTVAENRSSIGDALSGLNALHNTSLLSPLSVIKKAAGDIGGLSSAALENPERAGDIFRALFSREGLGEAADAAREGFAAPEEATSGIQNFIQRGPMSLMGRSMSGLTRGTKNLLGQAGFSPTEQRYYTLTDYPRYDITEKLYNAMRNSKVLQHVSPFARIGFNRLERGYERSLPGLVSLMGNKASDAEAGRKIVDKAILGTGVSALAYGLTPEGFVKKHPVEASGIAALGGPYGIPILAGEALKGANVTPKSLNAALKGTGSDTLTDLGKKTGIAAQTIAQDIPGLRLIEQAAQSPVGLARNYFSGYTNFLRPVATQPLGGLNPLGDAEEPALSTRDMANMPWYQQIFNRAGSNVPGIRQMLPRKEVKISAKPKFNLSGLE